MVRILEDDEELAHGVNPERGVRRRRSLDDPDEEEKEDESELAVREQQIEAAAQLRELM